MKNEDCFVLLSFEDKYYRVEFRTPSVITAVFVLRNAAYACVWRHGKTISARMGRIMDEASRAYLAKQERAEPSIDDYFKQKENQVREEHQAAFGPANVVRQPDLDREWHAVRHRDLIPDGVRKAAEALVKLNAELRHERAILKTMMLDVLMTAIEPVIATLDISYPTGYGIPSTVREPIEKLRDVVNAIKEIEG